MRSSTMQFPALKTTDLAMVVVVVVVSIFPYQLQAHRLQSLHWCDGVLNCVNIATLYIETFTLNSLIHHRSPSSLSLIRFVWAEEATSNPENNAVGA